MEKTQIAGIYKTSSGYFVRVARKCPFSGKTIEKTQTLSNCFDIQEAIKTKEEIAKALKEELSEGKDNLRDISKGSYEAYIQFYQVYRLDNGLARKNSVMLDSGVFERFILPHIGKIKISQFNKRLVYFFLDSLRNQTTEWGTPFAKHTYMRAWRCFRASMRTAYRLGFVQEDICHLVSPNFPLAKKEKDKISLSKEEAAKLLQAAEEDGSRTYFLVSVMVVLGLRVSEVKALLWEDLNFEKNFINVCKSRHFGVNNSSVKNGRAFEAPLVGIVRQAAERYAADYGKFRKDKELLFPSERSKKYMDSSYLRKLLHRLCDKVGIKRISPHDARRTANTILMMSSVNPAVVRRVLNHKSAEMSDHYTRIDSKQAGQVIDAVWSEIK